MPSSPTKSVLRLLVLLILLAAAAVGAIKAVNAILENPTPRRAEWSRSVRNGCSCTAPAKDRPRW